MEARVLSEAMIKIDKQTSKPLKQRKVFRPERGEQALRISRVGSTIYLDEGNGRFTR